MTDFGTACGFIHKRFKRISNSDDQSRLWATMAFSLQVAVWRHYGRKGFNINLNKWAFGVVFKCSGCLVSNFTRHRIPDRHVDNQSKTTFLTSCWVAFGSIRFQTETKTVENVRICMYRSCRHHSWTLHKQCRCVYYFYSLNGRIFRPYKMCKWLRCISSCIWSSLL